MKNSILSKYHVNEVPLILKPIFYLYGYGIPFFGFIYLLIVRLTSKIVFIGRDRLEERSNYIFCFWHTFIFLYFTVFLRTRLHVWMQHPTWYMKPSHVMLRFIGVNKIVLGSSGWDAGKSTVVTVHELAEVPREKGSKPRYTAEYSETHHAEGKPREVIELYRGLDRFCQDLAPGHITRAYKTKYVSWSLDKKIFCCAHLQQGGLRVWVKTNPKALDPSESFARDVSKIGHWGVGDVELAIDSLERLHAAEKFVRESFDRETRI
jgi:predicted transport protein